MGQSKSVSILVRPSRGWIGLGARELWQYRDLGYFLVWRDLKVRYRQTAFGAAWAVLQPLLLMLVFSLFLGRVNGISPEGVPYPLFALAGLVPWTLFSQSLTGASNSLVSSQNLISKVFFPRLLLPIAGVASYVIDFVIAAALLLLATAMFGPALTSTILLLPFFGVLAMAAALATGLWLAAVNVRYRDVKYAVPFIVQAWLLASPVAYSANLIPEQFQGLYALNPMVGAIVGVRWAMFGGPRPDAAILISFLATLAILVPGVAYFRRVERSFADVI
jgi:homopolymeric O-antigen transport system permease protein